MESGGWRRSQDDTLQIGMQKRDNLSTKDQTTMDNRVRELLEPGQQVVDLGCGSGQLLADMTDLFSERIGLDVSRQRLKTGNGSSARLDIS